MPLDLGYVGVDCMDGDVSIKIYYQTGFVPGAGQTYANAPLVNGPRGYCLDVTNVSGRRAVLNVTLPDRTTTPVVVQRGDPVTTGPAAGRSRTLAQMQALGFTTRGSISNLSIEC
jgi:hypothetical protein